MAVTVMLVLGLLEIGNFNRIIVKSLVADIRH